MTEIAIFAENSLFAPFAPFFSETQTSQKGRKKEQNGKIGEAILGLSGCNRNESESIGTNQNQSELIGSNRINSDKL